MLETRTKVILLKSQKKNIIILYNINVEIKPSEYLGGTSIDSKRASLRKRSFDLGSR